MHRAFVKKILFIPIVPMAQFFPYTIDNLFGLANIMTPEKIIGMNIRRLRKERGWRQKDLAEKYAEHTGKTCNDKYISFIETGRQWLGKGQVHHAVRKT